MCVSGTATAHIGRVARPKGRRFWIKTKKVFFHDFAGRIDTMVGFGGFRAVIEMKSRVLSTRGPLVSS